ncbi:hypothetical protein [Bradyrhizobium sp. dw_78]|uniref:hypothetical protein n=1 Tax=Bradyrhizobium sp. dw_78 TaxID=2719793 RepID=UPI001BD3FDAC|nr:hypothetical protein [Bradyrhizobium sp. dw_78]
MADGFLVGDLEVDRRSVQHIRSNDRHSWIAEGIFAINPGASAFPSLQRQRNAAGANRKAALTLSKSAMLHAAMQDGI